KHMKMFSEVMEAIEKKETTSIRVTKELLKKSSLKQQLVFIQAHFSHLPDGVTELERNNVALSEPIAVSRRMFEKLESTPGEIGAHMIEKCRFVIQKNKGFKD